MGPLISTASNTLSPAPRRSGTMIAYTLEGKLWLQNLNAFVPRLLAHLDQPIQLSSGETLSLREDEIRKTFDTAAWITHAGWRLSIPRDARLVWPVLPHNPYRKQGDATIEEARIVVALPFSTCRARYGLTLTIE